jgi:hypothetical protein
MAMNDRAKLAALAALSIGDATDDSYRAYSPGRRPTRSPASYPSSPRVDPARVSPIRQYTGPLIDDPPHYPRSPDPQQYYGTHPPSNYGPFSPPLFATSSSTLLPLQDTHRLAPQPIAAAVPICQPLNSGNPYSARPQLHIPLSAPEFPPHSPIRAALVLGPPSPALSSADTLVGSHERFESKARFADPENDRSVTTPSKKAMCMY